MKRDTKEIVAIKLMKNIFGDSYQARKTLREIKILRKLSKIPNNLFVTQLIDIILPSDMQLTPEKPYGTNGDVIMKNSQQKTAPFEISKIPEAEMKKFTHIFLVMELVESDMKKLLSCQPPMALEEEHIITILYNSLCALNYMHSANIIHRDIKPGNFLINSSCSVKICDFGLARTMPKKDS